MKLRVSRRKVNESSPVRHPRKVARLFNQQPRVSSIIGHQPNIVCGQRLIERLAIESNSMIDWRPPRIAVVNVRIRSQLDRNSSMVDSPNARGRTLARFENDRFAIWRKALEVAHASADRKLLGRACDT